MHGFLDEIQATLDCGIWSTAVASCLLIPDAAGAVEYPEGVGGQRGRNATRYTLWYDKYVAKKHSGEFRFDGEVVWKIRNAMLHETSLNFSAYGYDRILFSPPNGQLQIDFGYLQKDENSEVVLVRSLANFCSEIMEGARQWLKEIEAAPPDGRADRLSKLVQIRPMGLAPYIVGSPVIA